MEGLSPEVHREPSLALDGGEDGLTFYRRFLSAFQEQLLPDGFFLFEIGYDQKTAIEALAEEYGMTATVYPDYGGRPRIAHITKRK
jgi:release factor glutamine methyltransferase